MQTHRLFTLCYFLLFAKQCRGSLENRTFPVNFKFGVATAAYQIEGAWDADGKGQSIWDELTHKNDDFVKDSSNGDNAANSYLLWRRDVEMLQFLGVDYYRFSISWPRILPSGFANHINEPGVEYYNNIIDELLKHNITPVATLYHWDLPSNLQNLGGFANPLIAEWFEQYSRFIFEKFGDRVKHWITINEPKQICYEGYGSDLKAPALNMSGIAEYICAKNVLLAHTAAYHLYDRHFRKTQNGVIGISISCTWFEPASDSVEDIKAAEDAAQFDTVDMQTHRLFTLCYFLLFAKQCRGSLENRTFPVNFKFGVATAAYQIEGAWDADGKGQSIWDELTHKNDDFVKDSSNGDNAANSYLLWRRDVEMLQFLGVDYYRFSISWPRILPSGFANHINEPGVEYYNNIIDELLKHNITPVATLYHWDLPSNLQNLGGFANPLIAEWFEQYSRFIFEKFGDRVKHWITINEPKQICYEGYGSDLKAPALNMSGIAEYICAKNVLLAHTAAYHLYDRHFRKTQNGVIGISISCTWFEPASDSVEDIKAAEDAAQFDWGQYAHPIFSKAGDFPNNLKMNIQSKSWEQKYGKSRLPELSPGDIELIRGSSDFFGMNTYTSKLARKAEPGNYAVPSYMDDMDAVLFKDDAWPQAMSEWLQSVPSGFYKLLLRIGSLYDNPPIWVTENGWSTGGGVVDDVTRVDYHRDYLNALLDAIEQGADVKGYTVWSLMDNFEWKNGYTEKFGLYQVDFDHEHYRRTPRKSAFFYRDLVKNRFITKTTNK